MLVEGAMQYVWDETGKRYLDGLGGIVTVSVGHCHPHVVAAANRQNELLQHSTTLYLHPNVALYAEKLASKMPGELKVCYFVNSGSEANDLALLMARAYTAKLRRDCVAQRVSRRQCVRHGRDGAKHLEIQCAAQLRRASRACAVSISRVVWLRRRGRREKICRRCEVRSLITRPREKSRRSSPNPSRASAVSWNFRRAI